MWTTRCRRPPRRTGGSDIEEGQRRGNARSSLTVGRAKDDERSGRAGCQPCAGDLGRQRSGNTRAGINPHRKTTDARFRHHSEREPQGASSASQVDRGPKTSAPNRAEEAGSEEEEYRCDIAIQLPERSKANKLSDKQLMPIVVIQCKGCKTHVELARNVSTVCAAGILVSRFYL